MAHICKKCFLREMAEEDAKMIEKYKKGIKETDRVSEKKYEERLAVLADVMSSLGLRRKWGDVRINFGRGLFLGGVTTNRTYICF